MANPEKQDPKQQEEPCPPPGEDPCGDDYGCDPLPTGPEPPTLKLPETCKFRCECPGNPKAPEPPCFDELIACQSSLVDQGQRATQVVEDLKRMREDANKAKETYNRETYEVLKRTWEQQDKEVVAAIKAVTCNIPCWWCVIDCHVCQELYRIRWIEERLEGPVGKPVADINSLRALELWHQRNVAAKQLRFDYIDKALKAWSNPAKTIKEALDANQQIITSTDPTDRLLKVFFELIPRHLAIAPRPLNSQIEDKYIRLCTMCDEHEPDDCCGPDVALPSARQLLTEPQAYIVDPDEFFDLLCCIATQRFGPAKLQLEQAKADRDKVSAEVKSLEAELDQRKKDPLAKVRGNIPAQVDCDKYKKKNGGDGGCADDESEPDHESEPNAS